MVALGGVEDQLAEEFAGGGVDDADVQVLDEQQDVDSGVGSADTDVVQPALSILSWRSRSWVSRARLVPGVALGRAA